MSPTSRTTSGHEAGTSLPVKVTDPDKIVGELVAARVRAMQARRQSLKTSAELFLELNDPSIPVREADEVTTAAQAEVEAKIAARLNGRGG